MDPAVARILDANANRAREAARVLEEYARFARDDAPLTARAKQLRHDLSAALRRLNRSDLLASRDTPHDVGTTLSTAGEMSRHSPDDVVAAAAARLTEALRALEEYGKIVDTKFSRAIESIRYVAYDIEKSIVALAGVRERWQPVRLYVLLTESFCAQPWQESALAVLRGGADAVQLREKNLCDREWLDRAHTLREMCRAHGALLIVNDRPDIARLTDADGVHVGQDDMDVTAVRRVIGSGRLVGKSTHTLEQARAAREEDPDYIAVGPMFDSVTKPQDHIAGPATLRHVAAESDVPLVAIGGITLDRLAEVQGAGASCVCVCGAILSADDPEAATRAFKTALRSVSYSAANPHRR